MHGTCSELLSCRRLSREHSGGGRLVQIARRTRSSSPRVECLHFGSQNHAPAFQSWDGLRMLVQGCGSQSRVLGPRGSSLSWELRYANFQAPPQTCGCSRQVFRCALRFQNPWFRLCKLEFCRLGYTRHTDVLFLCTF